MIIKNLLSILTRKDKKKIAILFFLSIFVSVIEVAGISSIIPFIRIVTNHETIFTNENYRAAYEWLGLSNELNFIITMGFVLVVFYALRSIVNLAYIYLLTSFTQKKYHSFSVSLFKKYMGSPNEVFVSHNSSSMTKNIVNEAQNLSQAISSFLFMISEIAVFLIIYAIMVYIDAQIALIITIIIGVNSLLILQYISRKIKKVGSVRAAELTRMYSLLNSNFGNYKISKLKSNTKSLIEVFSNSSKRFTDTNTINVTLTNIPRFFFEAVGFSTVILITIYFVWKHDGNITNIIPALTLFVLMLYRLMPSFNRITTSYNEILYFYKSIEIINKELEIEVEELGRGNVEFRKKLTLNNIYFEYRNGRLILNNINLIIPKGGTIGLIGESGGGKSTLIDLIMGLNKPSKGEIISDDSLLTSENLHSWRSKIGYIPQSIYLFDGTVGENIAMGGYYDRTKIDLLLKEVSLLNSHDLADGQDTLVGEGGAKLSGGQKQRVAIARALYTNPQILILDEATSALDYDTENEIMNAIYSLRKTITLIIVAHRLNTLNKCDYVYELNDGCLKNA